MLGAGMLVFAPSETIESAGRLESPTFPSNSSTNFLFTTYSFCSLWDATARGIAERAAILDQVGVGSQEDFWLALYIVNNGDANVK